MLRNFWYLVKTTLAVYLMFYKLIRFETLIIFLEATNNFYHADISSFFQCFFSEKDPRINVLSSH